MHQIFYSLAVGLLMVVHARQISTRQNLTAAPGELSNLVLSHIAATKAPTANSSLKARQQPGSRGLLDDYITVLPTPSAPREWVQMCVDIETKGAAALPEWLNSDTCPLPNIQGSTAARCQLGRRPWAHQFKHPVLGAFTAALFQAIVAGWASAEKQLEAPPPRLTRFDLFHGHVFVAGGNRTALHDKDQRAPRRLRQQHRSLRTEQQMSTGGAANSPGEAAGTGTATQHPRVGVLFHASEYPVFDPGFPIFLGHCQQNSTCSHHPRSMDLRNIIWYQGRLAVLDVGVASPLHGLLHEGTELLRTVYEEDFGRPVADLLFLQEPRRWRRNLKAAEHSDQQQWKQRLQSRRLLSSCSSDASNVFVLS